MAADWRGEVNMIAAITREEFWSSPIGIAFIGLAVGVVVLLAFRALRSMKKKS